MMRKFTNSRRKIGPKPSSLSGKFISRKQGNKIIQFESSLEKDFILLCEFDNDIIEYVDQPVKIKYIDSKGKSRSYTPDFFLKFSNKNKLSEIIEIKYSSELKKNSSNYEEKFNHARLFCENNSLTFNVLTEENIRIGRELYLKNINFLLSYKEFPRNRELKDLVYHYNIDICLELINLLRNSSRISINKLITLHNVKYMGKDEILKYIWFLISNNYVSCNLNKLLNKNSLVWVE